MSIETQGQHPISPFANGIGYDGGVPSTATEQSSVNAVGTPQIVDQMYIRKALLDIRKYMLFQQIGGTMTQVQNHGTKMSMYVYEPVIDDANKNDQGIDANGLIMNESGNMWGSSRDPGKIRDKLPVLGEFGGRVNRIGFTRKQVTGTINKYGFFFEYSNDELSFDTDKELYTHITALAMEAANKVVENLIQLDLISGAGVKIINGSIDADGNVNTEIKDLDDQDTVNYGLFKMIEKAADDNRVAMDTKIIKGSRLIDTKVVSDARIVYVPTELMSDIERMKDFHDNKAFVEVEHYAAAGNIVNGEAGKVGALRIIKVLEMQDAGVSNKDAAAGFYADASGKYRVFPLLLVGKESFYTITFHARGDGNAKFRVISKKPGFQTANLHDPYGERGFWSCKFYYGSIIKQPEKIICAYVTAKI